MDRFRTTFGLVFGPVSDCFCTSFGLLLEHFWPGVVHESSFPNTYNGTKHRASTIWLLNKNSTIVVVKLHQCSSDRKYVAPLQALMQPPSSSVSAHTIAGTWPYHWCNHLALALVHWSLHPADGFLLLTQCTLSGM